MKKLLVLFMAITLTGCSAANTSITSPEPDVPSPGPDAPSPEAPVEPSHPDFPDESDDPDSAVNLYKKQYLDTKYQSDWTFESANVFSNNSRTIAMTANIPNTMDESLTYNSIYSSLIYGFVTLDSHTPNLPIAGQTTFTATMSHYWDLPYTPTADSTIEYIGDDDSSSCAINYGTDRAATFPGVLISLTGPDDYWELEVVDIVYDGLFDNDNASFELICWT